MRVSSDRLVASLFALALALTGPAAIGATTAEFAGARSADPATGLGAATLRHSTFAQAAPATDQAIPEQAQSATAATPAPGSEQAPAESAATPAPAQGGLAGALAHFLEDDFSETDTGITEVVATGDPRAGAIIEALQGGRLLYSTEQKKVYYRIGRTSWSMP